MTGARAFGVRVETEGRTVVREIDVARATIAADPLVAVDDERTLRRAGASPDGRAWLLEGPYRVRDLATGAEHALASDPVVAAEWLDASRIAIAVRREGRTCLALTRPGELAGEALRCWTSDGLSLSVSPGGRALNARPFDRVPSAGLPMTWRPGLFLEVESGRVVESDAIPASIAPRPWAGPTSVAVRREGGIGVVDLARPGEVRWLR